MITIEEQRIGWRGKRGTIITHMCVCMHPIFLLQIVLGPEILRIQFSVVNMYRWQNSSSSLVLEFSFFFSVFFPFCFNPWAPCRESLEFMLVKGKMWNKFRCSLNYNIGIFDTPRRIYCVFLLNLGAYDFLVPSGLKILHCSTLAFLFEVLNASFLDFTLFVQNLYEHTNIYKQLQSVSQTSINFSAITNFS